MTHGRGLGRTLAALLVAAAAGCAPMATKPGPTSASTPPTSTGTHPGSTSSATTPTPSPTAAVIDTTTPSPAAQRVLASIPEPLTPAQQALNASQDSSRMQGRAVAPAAAYDSLQAAPVPAATQPLGTEVNTVTMADSGSTAPVGSAPSAAAMGAGTASGAAAAGAATGPASTGAASSGAAPTGGATAGTAAAGTAAAGGAAAASASGSGPCWRLQVGAPLESEKEKADSRREAAQSLLMVSFTIVPEKGYLKVRTSDCLSREAADALKKRALESGFEGAFLIDTNAPPPPPAHKHQTVPASKRKH